MTLLNRFLRRLRRQFLESSALFLNIIRWTLLATIVGAIVGGSTALFIHALHGSIHLLHKLPYYFFLLPVGLWLSTYMIKLLAPQAAGHGTEKVIDAVHRREGRMYPGDAPVKLTATVITIATGGSAGKEGPAAQIGATLASLFADIFRLNKQDRKKLVICGISAGFAAIFSTPVAGALFGVEVLFLGQILYEILLPSFVAGVTAYQVSSWLGANYFWDPLQIPDVINEALFVQVIFSGVIFGLVAILFIEALKWGHRFFQTFKDRPHFRPLFGGILLVGFGLLGASEGLGLGVDSLERVLSGESCPWWLWIFKSVATGITLGAGGSGGVVTPIFVVGASAGSIWGRIIGADPALFAALGMVAVLSGCANTPIAASVMGLELFGPSFGPYGAVVCVVSFLMTGYRGVYSSQILARQKSEILTAPLNQPIPSEGKVSLEFDTRKKFVRIQHFFEDFRNWIRGVKFWRH
ncbi:voltage-gated chloride channel [candidate division LCP-89 bacterium B3_LCP]|uniref:Voltage-gated chloride channel n=1 Tax=candidate division LCP-89 bacterium B3_LCP TaxID=2012998 RepID=A0A532V0A6_UNCL8|nr:MAG: voltage-gated chloride channel [candidate division LCP-89 bacterium B3_LCP]